MAEYKTGEIDSAFIHINQAIELYPTSAIPWTTLAEVYAVKNDHTNFYKSIEKAVELGFDLSQVIEDEIYRDYADQRRFKALLKDKLKS